jgi:RimJ/RimL family protein N-acetyltransferase
MQNKIVFLEGKRIYLRPIDLSDLETLQRYANDPLVRQYLTNVIPVSKTDEETWIKKVMTRGGDVNFAVVLKKNQKLLGTMALMKINYVDGVATTGSMLGAKEEWNKGYAKEAKMLVLEYAFMTLNLRKICSAAFADNKGSIKHNLNCGYKIEGKRIKQFYRDGKYHDEVLLAVFKSDWLKLKK